MLLHVDENNTRASERSLTPTLPHPYLFLRQRSPAQLKSCWVDRRQVKSQDVRFPSESGSRAPRSTSEVADVGATEEGDHQPPYRGDARTHLQASRLLASQGVGDGSSQGFPIDASTARRSPSAALGRAVGPVPVSLRSQLKFEGRA